jgi:DME family drug/metabolite transporter
MEERKFKKYIESLDPRLLVFIGALSTVGISITAKELTNYGLSITNQVLLRNIFAAIFMVLIVPSSYRKFSKTKLKIKTEIVLRSSIYLGAIYLFAYAFNNTNLVNVGLLSSLPFVAVIGLIFFKDKLTKSKIVLLVSAFLGAIIISGFGKAGFSFVQISIILGSFLFALTYETTRDKIGRIDNEEFSTITQVVASLLILIIFLLKADFYNLFNHINLENLLLSLACSLCIVINMITLGSGMKRLSSLDSNIIMYTVPVLSVVASIFIFREFPKSNEIIGGLVILVSCSGLAILEKTIADKQNG